MKLLEKLMPESLSESARESTSPKSQQGSFVPPFCPHPSCTFHTDPIGKFWRKNGRRKVDKYPGYIQRYQCKHCKKYFSYTSFLLEYRRRSDHFESIFTMSTSGMSNCSIGEMLGISEHKVRECLKLLARQGLLKHELLTQRNQGKKIRRHICNSSSNSNRKRNTNTTEELVYDGFESFSRSQYDPNNVNNLVLKESLFTLDFSFSHLNRKGRMTDAQKIKNKKIQQKYGKYPTNQIRAKSEKVFSHALFRYLPQNLPQNLPHEDLHDYPTKKKAIVLHTDEHKSYPLALKDANLSHLVDHQITNSKKPRNSQNNLFPVNHLDMCFRHFLKSQTRETIAFNKNEAGMMDRIIIFLTSKIFLKPVFRKKQKNKEKNRLSPAVLSGFADKVYSFKELFAIKLTSKQVKLREHWKEFYFRKFEHARYPIAPYLGV